MKNWKQKFLQLSKLNKILVTSGVISYSLFIIFLLNIAIFGGISSGSRPGEVAGTQDVTLQYYQSLVAELGYTEENYNFINSQKINSEIEPDRDTHNADLLESRINNLQIAELGNSTKNKRLFEVTKVIDGDTIEVEVLGTIRLIGINASENEDQFCNGAEVTQNFKDLLDEALVYLEFDPELGRLDITGRTLAYVYLQDGLFLNEFLISSGQAKVDNYEHRENSNFSTLEEESKNTKKGIWDFEECR